ncbi:translation initiation factor Sui1 [Methylogaea oryzae]|uniref:translation initiation factor Sui1 n=1 Tax=Methylogaea oryzae TaxID=1295382 RepID=UPI001C81A198|nr:translation initiation factor Sui1 [Methylogaea oryzae]
MRKTGSGKSVDLQGGLVYSTEHGRMCPECRKPVAQCACRKAGPPAAGGPVRVRRETKGRAGKGVTVIAGAPLDAAGLADLGKRLKTKCGSGGTVKDGTIEIQGDHCELVMEELKKLGWNVKRSGG